MKQLTYLLLTIIFVGFGCSSQEFDNNERIEIIFNNSLNSNDLDDIKMNLKKRGITINYTSLEFDESKKLKGIAFSVDCHDGFSGSASMKPVGDQKVFGFYRDYSDEYAVSPFGTGHIGKN
ncbi:MAG: hypothetical protein RIA63_10510 [Cyclobacteriaceae bacterium]